MNAPDDLMCSVCRRPLDVLTDMEGNTEGYWHASGITMGPPHEPVPVTRDDSVIVGICDFCGTPTPGLCWRYPAKTFDAAEVAIDEVTRRHAAQMAVPKNSVITPRSCDDWMACDVCHGDIQRNRWEAITDRACRSVPRHIRSEIRYHIRELHRQFRLNRTGDPTPTGAPK